MIKKIKKLLAYGVIACSLMHAQEPPTKKLKTAESPESLEQPQMFHQKIFENMVIANDIEGVQKLLAEDHQIDLDDIVDNNEYGCKKDHTPLMIAAAFNRSVGLTDVLLKAGADVNKQTNCNNKTVFLVCMTIPRLPILIADQLLQAGANVHEVNYKGRTALHLLGCKAHHIKIAEELIARGVGVNIQDGDGDTPLSLAVINNKHALSACLIENGASVFTRNNKGDTPLSLNQKKLPHLQNESVNAIAATFDWIEKGVLPEVEQ